MKYALILILWVTYAYGETPCKVILPNNNEPARLALKEKYKMGAAGIPHLIKAIEENIHDQHNPDSNAALKHAVGYLNLLAKKGIYVKEEVPVLINLLKAQIHIKDTFVTAETIRLITKLDVGYSRVFVNSYTPEKEPERQEMITLWENLEKSN